MNMYDLKSGEPFFGRWYIKDYIGTTRSGSIYLIYSIESGISVYSTMKVIGVPKDKQELKQVLFHEVDPDSTSQYYKELVTDIYREVCLMEKINDRSHIVSYEEHMIFQRGNAVGFDIFLRMEYLQRVKDRISTSTMSRQEIIQMGKDVCEALCVCEMIHIVHGDICPEAIYMTRDGRFKLGDFSFTRYSGQTDLVLSNDNYYDYMAPEVYEGKAYDTRADIYSLGLVLYQYLNDHKLPFLDTKLEEATEEERQVAVKQRFEVSKLPNPCKASDELAKVLAKALEVNPSLRYQSAEEFKDALTAIGVFLSSETSVPMHDSTNLQDGTYVPNEVDASMEQPSNHNNMEQPAYTINMEQPVKHVKMEQANLLYGRNEAAAGFDDDRRKKRELELAQEANGKNMGPWILIFLVLVLTTSIVVLLSNVNYAKQAHSNSVDDISALEETKEEQPHNSSKEQVIRIPEKEPMNDPEKDSVSDSENDGIDTEQEPVTNSSDDLDPTTIILSGQQLSDISEIEGIEQAITIDLSNNQLSGIDTLKEATKVENLVLINNQIVNVEPLRDLLNLKALDISNNSVSSFVMLRNLENLEVLSASNNLITSLVGLERMSSLQFLYLSENSIEDISELEKLANLKLIDLSNNKVKKEDIDKLRKALPECIIIE